MARKRIVLIPQLKIKQKGLILGWLTVSLLRAWQIKSFTLSDTSVMFDPWQAMTRKNIAMKAINPQKQLKLEFYKKWKLIYHRLFKSHAWFASYEQEQAPHSLLPSLHCFLPCWMSRQLVRVSSPPRPTPTMDTNISLDVPESISTYEKSC